MDLDQCKIKQTFAVFGKGCLPFVLVEVPRNFMGPDTPLLKTTFYSKISPFVREIAKPPVLSVSN